MNIKTSYLSEAAKKLSLRKFTQEFVFQTSRSSGPGGQNVNKTETRVELRFDIGNSFVLNDDEKELIISHLKNRINSEGILIITVQDSRSQLTNKQLAEQRFYEMLAKALKKQVKRKATKPSASANRRRLVTKKYKSVKKELRGKITDDN
jgi:ribosome-associated protein